jgi:hypothetical protein
MIIKLILASGLGSAILNEGTVLPSGTIDPTAIPIILDEDKDGVERCVIDTPQQPHLSLFVPGDYPDRLISNNTKGRP